MDVEVRLATPSDGEALSRLAAVTFTDTFGHMYPPEDLAAYLASAYAPSKLAEEIAAPDSQWLIALKEGEAIGYANCTPCGLPHPEASAAHGELKRLYVLKAHHGSGLGRRMLERSLQFLDERYPGPQWIGVFSQNFGAQRLYARYGFEKVGEYEFKVGKVRDREFILRRMSP